MNRIQSNLGQRGFTLLEIMIIVAIIGLLAAIATPSFIKVRKQSQAKRIINDARVIDTAVDSWAMEQGKADGTVIDLSEVASHIKTGVVPTLDTLGNPFLIGTVGTNQVRISATTKGAMTGIDVDWGTY